MYWDKVHVRTKVFRPFAWDPFHPLKQFAPARPMLLHPLEIDTISSWPFSEACVYRWRCLVFHWTNKKFIFRLGWYHWMFVFQCALAIILIHLTANVLSSINSLQWLQWNNSIISLLKIITFSVWSYHEAVAYPRQPSRRALCAPHQLQHCL